MKVGFIFINTFSSIGGLQQYNRNLIVACLEEFKSENCFFLSLRDEKKDFPNVPGVLHWHANGNILKFILYGFKICLKSDKIVFGHINLMFPLGILFNLFSKKHIVLITHGIDIWRPLTWYKKLSLKFVNSIWTVSEYTRSRILDLYPFLYNKVHILYNTIPVEIEKKSLEVDRNYLKHKYNIPLESKILLSVCRISSGEKEKGYDKILDILPRLLKQHQLFYVLAGKAEADELERLKNKTKLLGVTSNVIFTGEFESQYLNSIYASSDVFVLPSKKEGFGIVFIEALLQNLPVIAGNKDGSVDALQFGDTGFLIDPDNIEMLYTILHDVLSNKVNVKGDVRMKTLHKFGFESFKKQLVYLLNQ
jgi:glycosyltransferase involved in cell wall biosynthesis